MARNTFVTPEPVVLEGYQAVLQPSKFGYSLRAVVDQDMVNKLEDDRTEGLKWAESKLKNPKRSVLKPEPWEEVSEDKYKVKFRWNEDNKPPVVDTEGTVITDAKLPIFSGSKRSSRASRTTRASTIAGALASSCTLWCAARCRTMIRTCVKC